MSKSKKEIVYIHFDTVDSTNNWAKTHAPTFKKEVITCVFAKSQTNGRGRFTREWISPDGENIYASLHFTCPLKAPYLANVGQILALSAALYLQTMGIKACIKWPNDIVVEGKKIGGVLTETVIFQDSICVIAGIGVNVSSSQEELKAAGQKTTSILQLLGTMPLASTLLPFLCEEFAQNLQMLQEKGFVHFQTIFNANLAYKGEKITCSDRGKLVEGVCLGVTEAGLLHLTLPDKEELFLSSAEIYG